MTRVEEELDLLRRWFGESVEYFHEGQWVRLPAYRVPAELWIPEVVEVALQIPPDRATNPYGFYARAVADLDGHRPNLSGKQSAAIGSYTYPASTPWGDDWGRFSWQLTEWHPRDLLAIGSTMLEFARSIADRFREGP